MKIVIIDKEEGQKIGGLAVYTNRLYQYLKSNKHKVYILRYSKKNQKQENVFSIPYYFAEVRSYIFLPTEETLKIIRKYLLTLKPDIVYTSNGLSPLDFLIPSVCHDYKIPLAGVWHADFNFALSSFQVLLKSVFLAYLPYVKQLDLLHVFSSKLAKFYIDKGVLNKRILILPNGVDQNYYKSDNSQFAKQYGIKRGILFLGRLTMQKNPEILIQTFLKLNPDFGTKLVLVGFGELENELRHKYQDKRIIFTGAIQDEGKKLDIMRSCQISVLPSRAEGMPLALLEAMSCGMACIASDAGANSDLLNDCGIVIPFNKLEQELPLALKLCLDHYEFSEILGKKARQKIIDEYSQETIFARLVASFEKTIYDYQQRGLPKSKPIAINDAIMKKIITIIKRLENLWSLNLQYQ